VSLTAKLVSEDELRFRNANQSGHVLPERLQLLCRILGKPDIEGRPGCRQVPLILANRQSVNEAANILKRCAEEPLPHGSGA